MAAALETPSSLWVSVAHLTLGMKEAALIFTLALAAGCASHERPPVSVTETTWANEARAFERTDVRAEVEERFQKGDFRFKGWVKSAVDTIAICPGISEEEGASLREASLAVSEILYIEDLPPFIVDGSMAAAWQKRTAALFDHMQRFNCALFEKLARERKVQNRPGKSPEPTPGSVTPRATEPKSK